VIVAMLHLRTGLYRSRSLAEGRDTATVRGNILIGARALNKRKRVAWRKHRIKAKKQEEKRKLGALARRTK
jgi:hypothetical protein